LYRVAPKGLGSELRLSLEPTEEFFRTDDGYPVRAWTGTTDKDARDSLRRGDLRGRG
jgi:hypothetical protein